jgi:hypothetical protein
MIWKIKNNVTAIALKLSWNKFNNEVKIDAMKSIKHPWNKLNSKYIIETTNFVLELKIYIAIYNNYVSQLFVTMRNIWDKLVEESQRFIFTQIVQVSSHLLVYPVTLGHVHKHMAEKTFLPVLGI